MTRKLKYGNTNTYLIPARSGFLLVDTDYAGTLPAFYRAIKGENVRVADIRFVLATHYHPDHMGLIGQLAAQGVTPLIVDAQTDHVRDSERLFERDRLPFLPVDMTRACVISCGVSRAFLAGMGISGEIVATPSHSADSVSLILDDESAFVGDTEPLEYAVGYENGTHIEQDWQRILSLHPKTIHFAHRPEVYL